MKIAIIGAGFTGLSAGYRLLKKGHDVTIFEKDLKPGGLALGYQEEGWDWTLEGHYHHWFTNDSSVLTLAEEIGHEVLIKRPKTSVLVDGKIYQMDSPLKVLLFPKLSPLERIRMAAVLGLLRYDPFWLPLEKINATEFLPKTMGKKSYSMIWEPQLMNKFGDFAKDISLSWFWARIKKRTSSLAYPKGGFLAFADHLVGTIEEKGGLVHFGTEVIEVKDADGKVYVVTNRSGVREILDYDKVIFTLPMFLFKKAAFQLPEDYKEKYSKLKGIGATNLVLRLKERFFPDDTYWLSVCDTTSPVMAIVEHTNFMGKEHYNNEHLLYLGNYMPATDPRFKLDEKQTLELFDSYLRKINPGYHKNLIGMTLFKAPFAQPIIPTNYSKMIPPFTTPLPDIYLANIEQVYPWDRGTNYAVELGEKVADLIE